MMDVALSAVARVLTENGWFVTDAVDIRRQGFSFELIAENEAALVFGASVDVQTLKESTRRLVAEVAAVTQRRSVGVKAWEAYLLLACAGDLLAHENTVQNVQHDLIYCRKIILPVDELETSPDVHEAVRRLLAFLLPLRLDAGVQFTDVRRALAEQLEEYGLARELVAELVRKFDEPSCRCAERVTSFVADESGWAR